MSKNKAKTQTENKTLLTEQTDVNQTFHPQSFLHIKEAILVLEVVKSMGAPFKLEINLYTFLTLQMCIQVIIEYIFIYLASLMISTIDLRQQQD